MNTMRISILVIPLLFIATGPLSGTDPQMKTPMKISVEKVPTVLSSPNVMASKNRLMRSPGTVLDSTYYDWQANGSLGYRIAMYHDVWTRIAAGWTIARQEDLSDRTMLAYLWEGTSWAHGLQTFHARSFAGSISYWDGGAVVLCKDADVDGGGYRAYLMVEAFPGIWTFNCFGTSIDTVGVNPRMTVNPDGTFIITGNSLETFNGISSGVMWDKTNSISGFDGWQHFSTIAPDWMHDDMEPPAIHSGTNGKVGVVIPDFVGSIRLFESTDYGEKFDVTTIATADTANLPSGLDSTAARLGWINSDIVYVDDEPHVVWTAGQGAKVGGQYGLFDFNATIFHWSPSTGIDTVVVASTQSTDPYRDDYVPTPYNHLSADWPSIGLAADGQSLVVAYTALNPDDVDGTALPPTGYLDIWMTASLDNGNTWTEPENVTNPDGTLLGWDDRYPSVAKISLDNAADPGKDVYMVYQSDDLAGTFVQGVENTVNMDYVKFLGVDLAVVGIGGDGNRNLAPDLLRVAALFQNYPNPFNPSTRIGFSVSDRNGEKVEVLLEIYDVRGRLVKVLVEEEREPGSYEVVWNGRDERGRYVWSGIYLYRLESPDFTGLKKMIVLR